MRIEVITHWFNEDFLTNLFLKNYSFADKIHIFLVMESSDRSIEYLKSTVGLSDRIKIHEFESTNGIDDEAKTRCTNLLAKELDCDWVISADFDEFMFALPPGKTIREFLSKNSFYDVIPVLLWQVYRNICDTDLDRNNLNIADRQHGDPNIFSGINSLYIKPMVVKKQSNIEWTYGGHNIHNKNAFKISRNILYGAHWAMADPELAIARRYYGRTLRQSKNNINQKLSSHVYKFTPESILKECENHKNDPKLFDLTYTESKTSDKVSVLIPYIREAGMKRCVEAIRENAGIPESQYEILAEEDKSREGCSHKLKELVQRSNYDIVVFLGDDTIPQKNFLKNALENRERLPEKWGLVGFNDHYLDGRYTASHWMADKRLLTEVLDGEFFHTGYRHCFADNELTFRCTLAGKYIFAVDASIDHVNPYTKKDRSLIDKDYKWAYAQENYMHDKWLFGKRKESNWTYTERN